MGPSTWDDQVHTCRKKKENKNNIPPKNKLRPTMLKQKHDHHMQLDQNSSTDSSQPVDANTWK
jgi:hypothetical protein